MPWELFCGIDVAQLELFIDFHKPDPHTKALDPMLHHEACSHVKLPMKKSEKHRVRSDEHSWRQKEQTKKRIKPLIM